ncbi:MAG: hypothetical protein H6734_28285 [Alphaproteobacteria bacterium]|nr:hypothetical protein [Alphaproteobacteria bacterium]
MGATALVLPSFATRYLSFELDRVGVGFAVSAVSAGCAGASLGLVVHGLARLALRTVAWPLLLLGAPTALCVGLAAGGGLTLVDAVAGVAEARQLVPKTLGLVAALSVPALPLVPLWLHARWRPWSGGTRVVSTAVLGLPLTLGGMVLGMGVHAVSGELLWPTRPSVVIEECEPRLPVNGQCPPGCNLECAPPPGCDVCMECVPTPPCVRVIHLDPEERDQR